MSNILHNRHLNCKVLSLLADKMMACGKLYWVVRSLDEKGSGGATFKIADVAKYFDISIQSTRRWVRQCVELGYFTFTKTIRHQNAVYVRYASYKVVAASLGLPEVGVVTWCDRAQMRNLKPVVTQAEMHTKQEQSLYKAKEANEQREKPIKFRGTGFIFSKNRKTNSRYNAGTSKKRKRKARRGEKGILFEGKRFMVILANKFVPFGASQSNVSSELNRHRRTVQRRLKGIERKQLAIALPMTPNEVEFLNSIGNDGHKPYMLYRGHAIEPICNVYNLKGLETSSGYRMNTRYKNYLKNPKSRTIPTA